MPTKISKGKSNFKFDLETLEDKSKIKTAQIVSQSNQIVLADSAFNNMQDNEEDILIADGVFKAKKTVLPRGSKLVNEFNRVEQKDQNDEPKSALGKKNGSSWNKKIGKMRIGLGFDWQKIGRQLALTGVVVAIIAVLGFSAVTAWALNQYNSAPNISSGSFLDDVKKETSVVYASDNKTKIFEFYKDGKREYISIDKIPEVMELAIIGLEDEKFNYNEDGIPWSNIAGAILSCLSSSGGECRGGSGLSQQLVKNVQNDRSQSLERKIRELFTAIKLNQEGIRADGKKVNKSDIMELYLNWIPFGRTSFGIQQASKSYFGHAVDAREDDNDPNSPLKLTPAKACYLAALPQQPSTFSASIGNPESKAWKQYEARKNICLDKLAGVGFSTPGFSIRGDGKELFIKNEEDLAKYKVEDVKFISTVIDDPYPHFREYVQAEIVKFLEVNGFSENDLYRRGLRIQTTIDPETQKSTEEALRINRDKIIANGGDNAAAVVLEGSTGYIKAMVGSLDYNDLIIKGKVNVLTTPQQPGSSIKPYVYASALNNNFNPGTVLMDTRTTFEGNYTPSNFSRSFSGPRSLRYSFANSLNIPAVKAGYLSDPTGSLNSRTALDAWMNFSENTGVRFPCQTDDECSKAETGNGAGYRDRCGLGSFLGGCEITALSHASGINTLLQEGNLRTATPFISIKDRFGEELFTPERRNKVYPVQDAQIKPTVAREIADVMSDQSRPEFGQFQPLFTIPGWKLAAKTGTTDDNRDTWMVGGSPLYTTVVWAGRTDNKAMASNVTAANLAAPIWQEIQKSIHNGKDKKEFSKEGLTTVNLDPRSGYIVDGGGVPELLNDEQIQALRNAANYFARPENDPRSKNIFTNRSSVIPRKIKFNKLDGNIAVEGKTLPENIEEKVCYDFLGEFPGVKSWRDSAEAWGKGKSDSCGELKTSEQDQVSDQKILPIINNISNLQNDSLAALPIQVNFKSVSDNRKILKAYLKANGVIIQSFEDESGTNDISLTATSNDILTKASISLGDKVTITLEVEDNLKVANSQTFSNITIGSPIASSTSSVQSSFSSSSQSLITAIIQNPPSKSIAQLITLSIQSNVPISTPPILQIGQNNDITKTSCTTTAATATLYSCNVSLGAGFVPGIASIKLIGTSNFQASPVSIQLVN